MRLALYLIMSSIEIIFTQKLLDRRGLSLFNHYILQPQALVSPKSKHVEQLSTGEPHIQNTWTYSDHVYSKQLINIISEQYVCLSKRAGTSKCCSSSSSDLA